MANLILIKNKNETINMNEIEVHPEEAIEDTLFQTKNIIPDVIFLKRQLRIYTDDRIDLIGLDKENNIILIELKDELVSEDVIPQVLKYAIWIKTNPDAIKNIWHERKHEIGDFEFDWEKPLNVKIMIIGPEFKPSVQKMIKEINYETDLIEFKKFNEGKNDYIFLNKLVIEEEKSSKPVNTLKEYDEEFYKKNYNPLSAHEFWELANNIENYLKKKNWNLTRSNTKWYISFKYGFPIVFGVTFTSSKNFALFFKVSKDTAEKIKISGYEMSRYIEQWNQVEFKVDNSKINLDLFEPLFEAAYKYISGGKIS